jgi:diguanylate cyclase
MSRSMPEGAHGAMTAAHSVEAEASVTKPAPAASDDWNVLFAAVRQTLRQALDSWPESASTPLAEAALNDPVERARVTGFGCADALDQLHETHSNEAWQRSRLEREVAEARAALAQARRELRGTEAEVRRARHLALHDGLTLLPNRDFMRQCLQAALARDRATTPTLALLYLDLDGFKLINDTHGHDTGDELLRIVAARLVHEVRKGDVVSRFGGDEFVCLVPDMQDRASLGHLACKLWDAVSAPVQLARLTLVVRPSIGIALSPADGSTGEALLKAADSAMYRAKRLQTGYEFADGHAPLRGVPNSLATPRKA